MADRHARAAAIADRIQAELQRLGRWATTPIDPGRLVDMGAFGRNTLAAEEWIQFVLVPRIRELAAKHDAFPATSETATWATREFDGDLDAGPLVELLRELDALIEAGDGGEPHELNAAVARADRDAVAGLLARGADVNARGPHGVTALHVAAAGGHPALPGVLANPFDVDVATILRGGDGDHAAIAELLLEHGAHQDAQADAGLTPLMVAAYFGRAEVAGVLRARGADEHLRDSWGRTAERLGVFQTVARAIALCRSVPAIASAYLVQLHAPATHQYTTPALGLELSGPLPPDAFATWPPDQPLVVFMAGGDDALSRLARLAAPIYPRAASSGRGLAVAIAAGVAGTVGELPSAEDRYPAYTVVLPDGRMPVLVREFGHTFTISVAGKSWHPSPGEPDAAMIREVVAATLTWSAEPHTVTIAELAADLAATLTAALGTRWTVSIPGTPVPSEMWLQGGGVSVGVFAGRIVLDADHLEIHTRDELAAARPRIIAAVRELLEQHARMLRLSERMHAIARELAGRLAARLGGSCTVQSYGPASLTPLIRWTSDGSERDIVKLRGAVGLRGEPDTIDAHAGVVGRDGWDGEVDQVDDEQLAAIIAAIERARRTLTIHELVVGQRYRVREAIGELVKGAIVKFAGFDDIDNHYGRYEFVESGGKSVAVHGDFSTPDTSPLGETHRYLEPLPD